VVEVAILRLKRRAEFLRVAAKGRKWAAPGLVLQAAPAVPPSFPAQSASLEGDPVSPNDRGSPADRSQGSPTRSLHIGFTASKKVGNAVARNRAKRRLRAAADQILPDEAALGYDYVLIARQETLRRPFSLLLQDLQTALKRVGAHRGSGSAGGPDKGRQFGREGP
jgi:ribonuclease P protein component